MKRAEIVVGRDYAMLVSGRVVRVTALREWNDTHGRTHRRVVRWTVRNLASNRLLENVGAGRFRAAWDESVLGKGPVADGRELHAVERARTERERAAIAKRDAARKALHPDTYAILQRESDTRARFGHLGAQDSQAATCAVMRGDAVLLATRDLPEPAPVDPAPVSWRPEVIADSSGKWCPNGLRFRTEAEALASAADLAQRWTLVRDHRAAPSTDPVNYQWTDGQLVRVMEIAADRES